ncbi:hypothetical protein [Pseudoalteromonas byunsanensis]|uniref:Uncharacterized protein n=1 Tax=Pseudoalteromonas byunsanensis TaxID=327939 RepID=A0A1S1NAS4_9GAMM|nr:hypothetical protein [Pseudoalteromonas byunsanensis]OHU97179.1 hypothetical protein BIW53_02335 [Pseudoalteromonas byunsanensis]
MLIKEEQDRIALHYIAGFLNSYGCNSLDDVDGALQHLIDTAKVTQSQYRNGQAEKATSVN